MTNPNPAPQSNAAEQTASEDEQLQQARSLLIQRLTEELSKPNPKASLLAVAAKFLEGVKPPQKPKSVPVSRLPFPHDTEEKKWKPLDQQPFITA